MVHLSWHRFRNDWPVWFGVAVLAWIAVSSVHLGDRIHLGSGDHTSSGTSATDGTAESAPTTSASGVSTAGVDVRVQSFRIDPDTSHPGTLDAEVTLDVRATTAHDVDFRAHQLRLRRNGDGSTVGPTEVAADPLTIAKGMPQIIPVTFHVTPRPGATYDLLYGGRAIFTGRTPS